MISVLMKIPYMDKVEESIILLMRMIGLSQDEIAAVNSQRQPQKKRGWGILRRN